MSDRLEIIRLYRAENQAMVDKDIAALNKILTPSMTLTHMTIRCSLSLASQSG